MHRILIPSDEHDNVVHMVEGYRSLGCDIVVGKWNLELMSSRFDVVHLQWPEELTDWNRPTEAQIDHLAATLDRWSQTTKLICTVYNLYPHRFQGDERFHRLYEAVYGRMRMIHHFCPTSRELVIREYPSTANRNHVVTTPFNYDRLLPDHRDREAARKEFGIEASDFVVLAFGAIRLWDEAMLLKTAVSSARVPRMRILMAARYNEPQSPMRRQWRRWIWKRWLRSSNIIPVDRYVPDEEVHKLFDAADVVVVPRMNSLASGVPSVAMTFGKLVIAPDFGVMPDFLAGTDNLLYKMGDPDSLRKAIEKASTLDLGPIGKNNRKVADGWSWEGITKTLLEQIDRM